MHLTKYAQPLTPKKGFILFYFLNHKLFDLSSKQLSTQVKT